jgi:hypothetical protein
MSDTKRTSQDVRFRVPGGREMLRASLSAFDPSRTYGALVAVGEPWLLLRVVSASLRGAGDNLQGVSAGVVRSTPAAGPVL